MTELDRITLCESLTTNQETFDAMMEALDPNAHRKTYRTLEEMEADLCNDDEE